VGYLSGGAFTARWWPVVLLSGLALGALAGLAVAPLAAWRGPAADGRVPPAFVALASAYAAVVVNHHVLPGRERLGPLPLAAAALALLAGAAAGRLLGRGWSLAGSLALPFLLVGGLALAGAAVGPGGLASVVGFLALAFGCVIAGGRLAGWAPRVPWLRRALPAAAAAGVAATLVAGASGLTGPRAGGPDFHDGAQPASPRGAAPRASLVLVVLDTVRASSVSAYGQAAGTTPRLDALAREGTLFTDVLTPSPWTVPAHASLFTGLAPSRHGAGLDAAARATTLDPGAATLAEILAAAGYATAGISANRAVSGAFGLDRGFGYFESLATRDRTFAYAPLVLRVERRLPRALLARPLAEHFPRLPRPAAEINARAVAWLRRPRPAGQPFFLFVNYMEAHAPYLAEEAPAPGADPRRAYEAALRTLDRRLGELLDEVRAQPGGEQAWIVVTADHGESLGEHGRGHGCIFHHEVLHVPLVVHPPRSLPAARGVVDGRPLTLADVLPLVLEGLGLPAPPGTGGAPREFRVAESGLPLCGEAAPRRAIQDARFKLIAGDAGSALYDRAADPAESRDVGAARPQERARLEAWLAEWVRGARAPRAAPPDPDRDERLRALGYVR
jgi:arylsulfatase A-like enzyme